jgi:hypothetical protein
LQAFQLVSISAGQHFSWSAFQLVSISAGQHFSWSAFQLSRVHDLADLLTCRLQGGVLTC